MLRFANEIFKLRLRQVMLVIMDVFMVSLSTLLSGLIVSNFIYEKLNFTYGMKITPVFMIIIIASNYITGSYRSLWRYAGVEEAIRIMGSMFMSSVLISLFFLMNPNISVTWEFLTTFILSTTFFITATRFSYRILRRIKVGITNRYDDQQKRVIIVGAGAAGGAILKEILENPRVNIKPIGFLDDDSNRKNMRIMGVPVLGTTYNTKEICEKYKIDEIIIAIPHLGKSDLAKVVNRCKDATRKVLVVPNSKEIMEGKVSLNAIRNVEIKDLLGRDEVNTDLNLISVYLKDKVVMVTGGGGSIGSELARQIACFSPKKLVIIDNYENNAYEIQNELLSTHKNLNLEVIIANIRDHVRLENIFKRINPDVVFHAAAHKHVPLMEHSPSEAIKNNVFGTYNVAKMAHTYRVKKFILVSTDKAVNPTNVMGATKRIAERIVKGFDSHSNTVYAAVRFGNVLGSNGSVIPLFKKQIETGGPVTVTHPDIIRYFMTIPEAVQLLIQAGAMAKGDEVFVLDMGEPVKIVSLAEDLIRLSGFNPYKDIDIVFTGLRPGEKLFEELLMAEEGLSPTTHQKIFIGKHIHEDLNLLTAQLENFKAVMDTGNTDYLKTLIKTLVPTYSYKEHILLDKTPKLDPLPIHISDVEPVVKLA